MSGQGCTHTKSEMSVGDPSAFADEMSKLVNTKAYRSVFHYRCTYLVSFSHAVLHYSLI